MSKIVTTILLVFIVSASCKQEKTTPVKPDYSKASWSIYRGDSNLSGTSDAELSDSLRLKWSYKTGGEILASPVIGDRKIFIGSTDGNMYALNIEDGTLIWKFNTGDDIEASALLLDNNIYFGNLSGDFFSLAADSGILNWKAKVSSDIRGSANYAVQSSGDYSILFVGCYDSKMYAINSETGEIIWNYETGNYINGTPAVNNNVLVFGGCDAKLHIISIQDGSKVGEVITGSYIPGSAAIMENFAYLGKYDDTLLKIDLQKQNIIWQFEDKENGGPFFSSPAVDDNLVVAGSRDGFLYGLDKETGKKKWSFKTLDEIDSSPVIIRDKVLTASIDGRLYLLNKHNGEKIWSYEIGASISSSPAVVDGLVTVGAEDGKIYTFEDVR